MKKNKMMRLASLLLVLTLMSTCAISGTFAKYVTSGTGGDIARVAKFGVTVTANGETFAKEYAKTDSSFTLAANTVVSSNQDKLLAPGTNGSMAKMTLSGTPEVAVRVSYEATKVEFTAWAITGQEWYCPIVVTVNNNRIYGLNHQNATSFANAIKDAVKAYSKDYAANTDLSAQGNDALDISWEWAFEGNDGKQTDEKDTILGNIAAGGTVIGFEIEITTTVTQID